MYEGNGITSNEYPKTSPSSTRYECVLRPDSGLAKALRLFQSVHCAEQPCLRARKLCWMVERCGPGTSPKLADAWLLPGSSTRSGPANLQENFCPGCTGGASGQ